MASPFKVFRKNQKLMLAFLGVLVMVGFVILPVWMQAMGVRRQANLRVATTTSYGDFQDADLRSLRWRRQAAIRFFQALGRALVMAQGNPMAVSFVLGDLAPSEDISPTSDEALVQTWLLARRAEELGFLVDERAVATFLNDLSQDRITPQGWDGIRRSVGLSDQDLVGVLRDELLALRLKRAFRVSLQGATPAQRWDYFQRLNRKVTIESLPVRVSDFVDQVADPNEATLEAFFDQHKDMLPDPTSPEPGFREPERIAVEYLKAEYEAFFERERKAVTQDEVAKHYQENKETYRQEALPTFFDEKPTEKESEKTAPAEETPKPKAPTPEPKPSAVEPKAPKDGVHAEPAQGQGGEQAPEAASPAAPAGEQPMPSGQEPAAKEPADKTAPSAPESKEDTSALETTSPFRLAAFAQEGPEEPKASEPERPADASEESAEGPTGEKGEPTAKVEPKASEDKAAATAKPAYLPLEKVEDEIRGKIARDRANGKIERLLNDLRNELSRYHDKLVRYEVDVDTKKGGEAPKPPERVDFAKLAEKHGLIARRTGLVSAWEAEQLDIGKSIVGGQLSFLESAFELPNHRPEVSQDANGDRYLFWRLEQVEERTPSLADAGVRERVLLQWKMIEARSLAGEAAKRMADEARAAGKPLAEAFAERPGIAVTPSEPFSWLDYGTIPAWMAQGPPSLGDVQGVETPGNDFMRAVFDLKKGEIGTAVNQPQTVVYVFQVTDSNPLPGVLWDTFVNETYWNYFRAADHDRSVAEQAWLEGIRSETGFRWDPGYRRQAAQRRGG